MKALASEAKKYKKAGYEFLAVGSYRKAREQFSKAIELCPDEASLHLGLGQTFFFQNKPNFERALEEFHRATAISPLLPEAHLWLGSAQEKSGQLNEAVSSFRTAIKLNPTDTRALISLGLCLTELEDYVAAVDSLRRAIKLKPHYGEASARLFLADALKKSGRIKEACKEWQEILKMPREYPDHDGPMKEAKELLGKYDKRPLKAR